MKKAPDAFRTISEVSDWLDTPAHVLRFWESKFSQVKPVKRAGGRRYYRPDDMRLLGGIKQLLHHDGLTIKGVQKILREKGIKHVAELSPQVNADDGASEMARLTADITQSVASAADRAKAPAPAAEPLKLSEVPSAPAPETVDGEEIPLFLRREDEVPAEDDSAEKISELYGRLKSLRSRMREA